MRRVLPSAATDWRLWPSFLSPAPNTIHIEGPVHVWLDAIRNEEIWNHQIRLKQPQNHGAAMSPR
jgi:hypothetical protein